MIFEKVNFNESVISKMKVSDFIKAHIHLLWQDRDEETRRKMLTQVYELIAKPRKKPRKK